VEAVVLPLTALSVKVLQVAVMVTPTGSLVVLAHKQTLVQVAVDAEILAAYLVLVAQALLLLCIMIPYLLLHQQLVLQPLLHLEENGVILGQEAGA
jgi:hypothetical protein